MNGTTFAIFMNAIIRKESHPEKYNISYNHDLTIIVDACQKSN